MEDELINLLENITVNNTKFDCYRQGSFTETQTYPDTFYTFWNNSINSHSYYNNKTFFKYYDYDINVYSNDVDLLYTLIDDVIEILESNDYIITNYGHDIVSDEDTHVARGINVLKLGRNEFNE